jgi:hypothetical protein
MRVYTWTIRWSNPYTKPPDGRPEVLLSVTRAAASGAHTPREISEAYTIGSGYAIFCCLAVQPTPSRKLSDAARRKRRRTLLRRRLETRTPLYAEKLYAEELSANPDYYGADESRAAESRRTKGVKLR